MTRPNTVPTVITDVNGKITTVHKRVDDKSVPNRAMPSPVQSISKSYSSDEMLQHAVEGCMDQSMNELLYDELRSIKEPARGKVVSLLEQREYDRDLFTALTDFQDALPEDTFLGFMDKMDSSYYDLKDATDDVEKPYTYSPLAVGMIRGLQEHEKELGSISPEQGDAVLSTMAALLHSTIDNDDYPETLRVRTDVRNRIKVEMIDELLEHIMEKPSESTTVSDLMHADPNLSNVQLMHLLKNPNASKALAEGAL